jgi:threonine dehydratase
MLTLRDVEAAAARIAGKVRRTPLLRPAPCRAPLPPGLVLKLEQL